jgi:hypothetical protein
MAAETTGRVRVLNADTCVELKGNHNSFKALTTHPSFASLEVHVKLTVTDPIDGTKIEFATECNQAQSNGSVPGTPAGRLVYSTFAATDPNNQKACKNFAKFKDELGFQIQAIEEHNSREELELALKAQRKRTAVLAKQREFSRALAVAVSPTTSPTPTPRGAKRGRDDEPGCSTPVAKPAPKKGFFGIVVPSLFGTP